MTVRRYLLVLDMDLLAVDEEFDLEPLNYFVAQQEREPCDVTVVSLVNTRSARLPANGSFCSAPGWASSRWRPGPIMTSGGTAAASGNTARGRFRHGDCGSLTDPRRGVLRDGGGTTGPMSPSGASSRSTITGA